MADVCRVLIMGCGGIGGVIAARLINAGHEVVTITQNARISEALQARGLKAIYDDGELVVPITAATTIEELGEVEPFDLAVLAVPPDAAEAAALDASALLSEGGVIVCCPNGLVEERLSQIIPKAQVLGGVVGFGAERLEDGVVRQTSSGGFVLGRLYPEHFGDADPGMELAARVLEAVGPIQRSSNLRGARWSKLAINCAISSLGTIGGDRLGALLRYRFVRRLALEVMTEVVEVARAEGVSLEKVAGTLNLDWMALDPQERLKQGSTGLFARHGVLLAVGAKFRNMRSSMLAAIERGRTPPVDFLNGEITARAKGHELSVPINALVQQTVHAISRGEQRSGLETLRELYTMTRSSATPSEDDMVA